jgi:hypothetical protein
MTLTLYKVTSNLGQRRRTENKTANLRTLAQGALESDTTKQRTHIYNNTVTVYTCAKG